MWSREGIKSRAKQNLKGKYWVAFAVSLIVSLLASGSNLFSFRFGFDSFLPFHFDNWDFGSDGFSGGAFRFDMPFESWFDSRIFALALILGLIIGLFGLAYAVFVQPVIEVGGNRWFSRSRESRATPTIGQVFSLFRSGRFLPTVGSMLWMNVWLFLWGLLSLLPTLIFGVFITFRLIQLDWLQGSVTITEGMLIDWLWQTLPIFGIWLLATLLASIPVIIKTYAYRMAPWILADNPQIGYRRALRLSVDMTRGEKLSLFVLDLSFIGWFLLGVMLCGIGIFFVMPYYQATYAELFAVLRHQAVQKKLCTMEELGFVPVQVPAENKA